MSISTKFSAVCKVGITEVEVFVYASRQLPIYGFLTNDKFELQLIL